MKSDFVPKYSFTFFKSSVTLASGGWKMRKVELTMSEEHTYKLIKEFVDCGEIKSRKKRLIIQVGKSTRQVNRYIEAYKKHGKSAFSHKNKNRIPSFKIAQTTRLEIVHIFKNICPNANAVHLSEILLRDFNINVSPTTVRTILAEHHELSPKSHRKTKRAMKKHIEQASTHITPNFIHTPAQTTHILDQVDSHPRKPRAKYFGELIQMDASEHVWFGTAKCHLHAAIDDTSGHIVGAYFDMQETLQGYYHVLYQILVRYGIPARLLTDNRTIFTYNSLVKPSPDKDTFTQFGYACNTLGIDIKTSSIPEVKGRIERLFGTLQSRLITEMQLANITTIDAANIFLQHFIINFNKQQVVQMKQSLSAFVESPCDEIINQTLAVCTQRTIDKGCSLSFNRIKYQAFDSDGNLVLLKHKVKGMVVQSFDKSLYFMVGNTVYILKEIEYAHRSSRYFNEVFVDTPINPKAPKQKISPPATHPWKRTYRSVMRPGM